MMGRASLIDMMLTGTLVVALATLVASKTTIPTECPEHDSKDRTVHLAHATDCTKYYTCNSGHKLLMNCSPYNKEGDRLYFNAALQVCDWRENVDCKHPEPSAAISSRVEVLPEAEIPTECPKVDPEEAVHLAHETDCTKFYKCNRGEKVPMDCPVYNEEGDRLYFNASLQVCDWPENVDCQDPVDPPPTTDETPLPEDDCVGTCPIEDPMPPLIAFLPNKDCRRFCICSAGKPYVYLCPPGFHGNSPSENVCAELVDGHCPVLSRASKPQFTHWSSIIATGGEPLIRQAG